jgi:hypothetical protein
MIAGISLAYALLTNSDGNHAYRSLRPIALCPSYADQVLSFYRDNGFEPERSYRKQRP